MMPGPGKSKKPSKKKPTTSPAVSTSALATATSVPPAASVSVPAPLPAAATASTFNFPSQPPRVATAAELIEIIHYAKSGTSKAINTTGSTPTTSAASAPISTSAFSYDAPSTSTLADNPEDEETLALIRRARELLGHEATEKILRFSQRKGGDLMYEEGYNEGWNKGYEDATMEQNDPALNLWPRNFKDSGSQTDVEASSRRVELGTQTTRSVRNISSQVYATAPKTCSASVQTNDTGNSPAATDTHPPPPPPPLLRTTIDWAEDAASIPIQPSLPPRDLSVLRSDNATPFGALQKRVKRRRINKRPPARAHSVTHQAVPTKNTKNHISPPTSSFFTRRHPSGIASGRPVVTVPMNAPPIMSVLTLDWDQDPRLADLSRALNALGWIHAP